MFTSVNAVEVVFNQSRLLYWETAARREGCCHWTKDSRSLASTWHTPDFVPEEYVAEAILPGLGDLRGKWVLLPRAEIARKALPEAIFKAGGIRT